MIDLTVFEREMLLLYERHDRTATPDTIARYYKCLCEQGITTGEFIEAAQRSFYEDEFFPSPKTLVEKVRLAVEEQLLLDWSEICRFANLSNADRLNPQLAPQLSPVGLEAYRAIGGLNRVLSLTDAQMDSKKTEFIKLAKAHQSKLAKGSQPISPPQFSPQSARPLQQSNGRVVIAVSSNASQN